MLDEIIIGILIGVLGSPIFIFAVGTIATIMLLIVLFPEKFEFFSGPFEERDDSLAC